jgi:uroporphyrinogen-III synthase
LQKYPVDQKRVIISEDGSTEKLVEKTIKYSSDTFLLPVAKDSSNNQLVELLDKKEINYTKAEVFKISFPDVQNDIDIYSYNMLVFFSPYGIQNLMQNYPNFKQENIIIGAFGYQTIEAAQKVGLNVQIAAPTPKHQSIFSAIDIFLQKTNTR